MLLHNHYKADFMRSRSDQSILTLLTDAIGVTVVTKSLVTENGNYTSLFTLIITITQTSIAASITWINYI